MNKTVEKPSSNTHTPAVGHRVISGVSFLLMQTVLSRAVSFGSQVLLARLLLPDDFTLAALAASASAILLLIQPIVGDVLIQRQRHFKRWANAAFWLSVASSIGALMVAVVAAPIAGWLFKSTTVAVLLVIIGMTALLNGIYGIWAAEQSIGFHFRRIAGIATVNQVVANGLMVLFAWLGMGAFSLVVPLTIAGAVNLALYASYSRFRPNWPSGSLIVRWRLLIQDGWILSWCAFASAVTMQADNFFLGLYHKKTMGNYVWGYSLSMQFVMLLSGSLRGTLLPAFSMISGDKQRADAAFLEANRLLAFVAMPLCILMVPAMPAVIRHIFSARWDGAAPLVQILLPSMGFGLVTSVAMTAMQSRGLYRRLLVIQGINACSFIAIVWSAAAFGGPMTVAVAVSLIYGFSGPVYAIAACAPCESGHTRKLVAALFLPAALAAAGAGIGWVVASQLGLNSNGWPACGLTLVLGVAVYAAGSGLFMRDRIQSMAQRIQILLSRSTGKRDNSGSNVDVVR